jgi:hypothetical protein
VNASVDPPNGTADTRFQFTATYVHPEGEAAAYVRIQVDDAPWVDMVPPVSDRTMEAGANFTYASALTEGMHTFRAQASDGFHVVQTSVISGPNVSGARPMGPGEAGPLVNASVDPPTGTADTQFRFVATYLHSEGVIPAYVRIQVDDGAWLDMDQGAGTAPSGIQFTHIASLTAGNHTFRVEASDGRHVATTPWMVSPTVSGPGADQPDEVTFLALQRTAFERYGVHIDLSDVERGTYGGSPSWKVRVGNTERFVSLDGTRILDDASTAHRGPTGGANPVDPWAPLLWLATVAGGSAAVVVAIGIRQRRKGRRRA